MTSGSDDHRNARLHPLDLGPVWRGRGFDKLNQRPAGLTQPPVGRAYRDSFRCPRGVRFGHWQAQAGLQGAL